MDDEFRSVVIDNGSYTCKAGFGGDDIPTVVVPSVVGYPGYQGGRVGKELENLCTEDKDARLKSVLSFQYPIERGIITDWDEMEKIWRYTFNELKVGPEEYSVLLTESVGNTEDNREKMAEIMFEKFNTRSLHIANQALLSLYSCGNTTGMSVNVGHGITQVVPVSKGEIIRDAAISWEFAGLDLTDYLMRMLIKRGYSFKRTAQMESARDIKEKLCSVALDFEQEIHTAASSSSFERKYELPDKQVITIGNEQFQVPEAMFQPNLLDKESKGIHEIIYDSIMKCDISIRGNLFAKIVLSGGSTMFQDFAKRMKKEFKSIVADTTWHEVIAIPEGNLASWYGGSKLASEPIFKDKAISREQYKESGPCIIK